MYNLGTENSSCPAENRSIFQCSGLCSKSLAEWGRASFLPWLLTKCARNSSVCRHWPCSVRGNTLRVVVFPVTYLWACVQHCCALVLLFGRQEGHPACKSSATTVCKSLLHFLFYFYFFQKKNVYYWGWGLTWSNLTSSTGNSGNCLVKQRPSVCVCVVMAACQLC